ncbi:MAG: hypothetical protein ABW046_11275, partial [Actinoplanes sp.]
MRTRHRRPTRTRTLVLATCLLGVLGAGAAGIASAQTTKHRPAPVSRAAPLLGPATRVSEAAHSRRPRPRPTTVKPTTVKPTAAPTTVAPTSPAPTTTAPPTTAPPTIAPTTVPPTTAPTTAVPTTPAADAVIDQVLAHINAARTANGLTAYVLSSDLSKASAAHNALMVGGC